MNEATPDNAARATPVAWNVIQIGARGSAFDPPNTKRAFTYDKQPGNVIASSLGHAFYRASQASAGDSIDRGLGLLKALQEDGFGVFMIGEVVTDHAATVAELRAEVERWKSRYDDAMQARADEQKRADAAERRVGKLEKKASALLQSMEFGEDSRGHFAALKNCLTGARAK